jgi:hypothetical protein
MEQLNGADDGGSADEFFGDALQVLQSQNDCSQFRPEEESFNHQHGSSQLLPLNSSGYQTEAAEASWMQQSSNVPRSENFILTHQNQNYRYQFTPQQVAIFSQPSDNTQMVECGPGSEFSLLANHAVRQNQVGASQIPVNAGQGPSDAGVGDVAHYQEDPFHGFNSLQAMSCMTLGSNANYALPLDNPSVLSSHSGQQSQHEMLRFCTNAPQQQPLQLVPFLTSHSNLPDTQQQNWQPSSVNVANPSRPHDGRAQSQQIWTNKTPGFSSSSKAATMGAELLTNQRVAQSSQSTLLGDLHSHQGYVTSTLYKDRIGSSPAVLGMMSDEQNTWVQNNNLFQQLMIMTGFGGYTQSLQPQRQIAPQHVPEHLPTQKDNANAGQRGLQCTFAGPLVSESVQQDKVTLPLHPDPGLVPFLLNGHAASEGDVEVRIRKRRIYKHEGFPLRLHRLLEDTDRFGTTHIVSYTICGSAFTIHKPAKFAEEILPKYFRHAKLASFKRQLSLYGFRRITSGHTLGAFQHDLFQRGRPELCLRLKRVSEFEVVSKSASSDSFKSERKDAS